MQIRFNRENKLSVEGTENKFKIYPNPIGDMVSIQSIDIEEQISELLILDPMGKIINQTKDINSTNFNIPASNFKAGVYFLIIRTKQGCYIQKFVKS